MVFTQGLRIIIHMQLITVAFLLICVPCTMSLVITGHTYNESYNTERKEALTMLNMKSLLELYVKNPEIQASQKASCNEQLFRYAEGIHRGETWAIKMLDSSSNIPTGVSDGSLQDLGKYDECMSVKVRETGRILRGRHCTYFLKIRGSHHLDLPSLALCLPAACNSSTVQFMLENTMKQVPNFSKIGVDYRWPSCSELRPKTLSTEFYVALIVVGSIVSLSLFITICDLVERCLGKRSLFDPVRKLFIFSIYTNGIEVFRRKNKQGVFPAIDGLRVISMFMIMIFHTILIMIITPHVNSADVVELFSNRFLTCLVTLGLSSVDTFFVISGFLTSVKFVKDMKRQKAFSLSSFYLRRYMRLTPLLLIIIFLAIILSNVGSGPRWDIFMDLYIHSCRKFYWSVLLYMQNIFPTYIACFLHVWYLAVDMQLHLLAPILLHALVKKPRRGYMLLWCIICLSMVLQGVVITYKKLPTIFSYNRSIDEIQNTMVYEYQMPYTRIGPYGLGILFGYLITMERINLKRLHIWLGSLVAILCFILNLLLSFIFTRKEYEYNAAWNVFYNCVSHPTWGFVIVWIIYISIYDKKSFLTRFLSSPAFTPLSRISYCFYLIHFAPHCILSSSLRTAVHWHFLHEAAKTIICSIMSLFLAFIVTVWIEIPIQTLMHSNRHEKQC